MKDFNKFKADFKAGLVTVPGEMFEQKLHVKVQSKVSHKYKIDIVLKPKESTPTPLQTILEASTGPLRNDPEILAIAATIQNKLSKIQGSGLYSLPPLSDELKLLSLEGLSEEDIEFLYNLLLDEKSLPLPHAKMRHYLEAFIPKASHSKATPNVTQSNSCPACKKVLGFKINSCFYCQKRFCGDCQLESHSFSRLGQTKKEQFCLDCTQALRSLDANDWMQVCSEYLMQGSVGSTKTALGCLAIALASSEDKTKPILEAAKIFFSKKLPELAMMLLATVLNEDMIKTSFVHGHILGASVLNALAENPQEDWGSKLELLQAAKEVCQAAEKQVKGSKEAPTLNAITTKTRRAIISLLDEDPLFNDIFQRTSDLWGDRETKRLIDFVTTRVLSDEKETRDKMAEVVVALVTLYEKQIEMMPKEDQAVLHLLRGLAKLAEDNLDGLADIEESVWIGDKGFEDVAIDVYIKLISKFPIFTTKEFFDRCLSEGDLLTMCSNAPVDDRCLRLLFPNVNEMELPFQTKWPHLEVVGLNVRGHIKFENSVSNLVKEGDYTEWDAALAYIDYIAACDHTAQYALCFTYASLWLYKYIKGNADCSESLKFALTKAIVTCLHGANGTASLKLSPVMKMYVARLSLGILLHTLQLTKSVASKEAIDQAASLLNKVLYNSRFCPLWDLPLVSLSEAALLNIKANRFHSKFLIQLQDVAPDERPITEDELHYQLYENDLCHVHPLEDSKSAKTRAMDELMKVQGWIRNDVTNLMASPLSLRDSEGWLQQSPTLGKSMEFAEIKGFSFKTDQDNPSIELLVIPADEKRGRAGLFSLDDVYTLLQMDEFFPAIFSLDPPNATEQHYHPFQQFRYEPETLQNTDFLHTLFETDYLMKSFTLGTEVSSKPPFHQRSCKEGILKGLPEDLVRVLKPIHEREGSHSNQVHRFWIQAGKMEYSKESDGPTETIRIKNAEMTIRSHPLFPGLDDKLEDTEHSDEPESAEAQFAADMTSAYDKISLHFPMFARLRELAKLQFIVFFLNGKINNLKQRTLPSNYEISEETVSEAMQEAKENRIKSILSSLNEDIGVWPRADDPVSLSLAVNKAQEHIEQHVPRSELESIIKPILAKEDIKVLSDIVDGLSSVCDNKIPRSTLESHVQAWLNERNSNTKLHAIKSDQESVKLFALLKPHFPETAREDIKKAIQKQLDEMILKELEKYQSFCTHVNTLRPYPQRIEPKACNWVPAAMYKENKKDYYSLCYGGVFLYSGIKEGNVPPLPNNVQAIKIKPCNRVAFLQKRQAHTKASDYHGSDFAGKSSLHSQSQGSGKGGSSNKGTSSSNSDASGAGHEYSSAHPGVGAGGRHGGNGSHDDDGNYSDDESDDDDYESEEEEGHSGGVYKINAKKIQVTGKRGLHGYAQVDSTNLPKTTLAETQVIVLHDCVAKLKPNLTLTLEHIESVGKKPQFDDYFKKGIDKIVGLDGKVHDIKLSTQIKSDTRNVIYCIKCERTNKMYVGKTRQEIHKRMKQHLYGAQNWWKKNGKSSLVAQHFGKEVSFEHFKVIILEDEVNEDEIREKEEKWMKKLGTRDIDKGGMNKIRALAVTKPNSK